MNRQMCHEFPARQLEFVRDVVCVVEVEDKEPFSARHHVTEQGLPPRHGVLGREGNYGES